MTARELVNRISLLDMVKQLGDRLTVGQASSQYFPAKSSTSVFQSHPDIAGMRRERTRILENFYRC